VLEQVIGCQVQRLRLRRDEQYDLNLEELARAISKNVDLVILVNPNSPTGRHVPGAALRRILKQAPATTRVWVDETYVDYVGATESLEQFAASSTNVVVCKSMSKVYALSGLRAAYLCGPQQLMEELRSITPPWAVSLPAQVAAVHALNDPQYYELQYRETHEQRRWLASELSALGFDVVPGTANFLLCHLPEAGPTASDLVARCRTRNLFLRDVTSMGVTSAAVRIAVKDAATNRQMMQIVADVLRVGRGVRAESAASTKTAGTERADVDSHVASVFS
jgi:histidinol-phosphate/aromatic aminotransferase/cobyric acid decarboxylase-like protein